MAQPTHNGRKLPPNDWEGDDSTPGAGGKYVTCMDTATGRAVYYATNGRVNHDGKWYRARVEPPDPSGVNFYQMDQVLHDMTPPLDIQYHSGWTKSQVTAYLRRGLGLIVTGRYNTIPRQYRFQKDGAFAHAMWVSHFDRIRPVMRLWDPLNPDLEGYGKVVPRDILWPFLNSGGWVVGYVPIQPA